MADYYQLKNQNIFNPPANTSLGNATNQFDDVYIQNDLVLGNTTVTGATIVTPKVSTIGYPGDDTAANPAGGQTITLTGSGFLVGASVLINGSAVGVVSVVSSTTITFTSPANSAGSYVLYVINTDGGTAIAIPGIQYSGVPTWTTAAGSLGSLYETQNFNSTVTATGDAPITYSLFSGSIPPGATFNSNGTITGTSQVLSSSTTYTFTVRATDAEAQDTDRSFSLTINPDVVTWSSPANGTTYTSALNSAISNVTLVATSAVGSGITYTANALPVGLSLTGANISGTPTVEANSSSLLTATANTTSEASSITINWVISVANDPYYEYNTLLIPGASTTFVDDASTNNFAVTINGDTKPNSFNPYTPGYYSNYFDGNGDYLTTPTSANLVLPNNQNWTVESWVYLVGYNTGGNQILFLGNGSGGWTTTFNCDFGINSSTGYTYLEYANGGVNGTAIAGSTVVPLNRWIHLAWVYNGTAKTVTSYVNGIVDINAGSMSTYSPPAATVYATIGRTDPVVTTPTLYFWGYMSNTRIVKGTAVYTSAFTPPTSPLTAIANTSLLTCQSNRFIDNSTNNFTLTVNGNTTVNSFDPFTPNSSYSSYGSGYFDGTGDYLSVPASSALSFAADFTIECWVNTSTISLDPYGRRLWSFGSGAAFYLDALFYDGGAITSNLCIQIASTGIVITGTIPVANGQWNHVALTRSGSSMKLFVNGVQSGSTYTNSSAFTAGASNGMFLGCLGVGVGGFLLGNITDFRVLNGTAAYTTAFTPPTEPLTAIANTSLLTLQNNQSVSNNVFLDNSSNNLLITRAGNTTQGTFSPYGGNWSASLNGTTDYLSTPYNTAFDFNTGNFTVECWFNHTGASFANYPQLFGLATGSNSGRSYYFYIDPSGFLNFGMYPDGVNVTLLTATTACTRNVWNHAALVRSSGTTKIYLNGVVVATATNQNFQPYLNAGSFFNIGREASYNGSYFPGYISNFRIVKGTALYTTTFTPPTTPLTPITNTVLLTCQSSRFIDNSINNLTITKVGDTSVQRFSPFNPSSLTPTSYSGYFDGTGDYVSAPYSAGGQLGSNNFTIEFWAYFSSVASGQQLLSAYQSGSTTNYALYTASTGTLNYYLSSNGSTWNIASGVSFGNISVNTWIHVALVRNGSTFTPYLNGVAGTTSTSASAIYTNTSPTIIGAAVNPTVNSPFTGYISNLRIVNGTAVYTATFTPPTTPLTAISGTSLLTLQSTTFIDNSTNNFTITAAGNSQPTQQNPFGFTSTTTNGYTPSTIGGSGYFDGTDYLDAGGQTAFAFGTGDLTFECWIYATVANDTPIYESRSTSSNTNGFTVTALSSTVIRVYTSGVLVSATVSNYLSTWTHIAFTRQGSTNRLFINGVLGSTATSSDNFSYASAIIGGGRYLNNNISAYFTGYITDVRLVKGTALYTSNFVPPSAPLTAIQNTSLLTNMTSAGIYDASMMNNMETVGDAKLSTAVSKFGGSSMYFDGTGDGLYIPNNINYTFGTGNFTIEFWIYFNSITGYITLMSDGYTQVGGWIIQTGNGTGKFTFYAGSIPTAIVSDTGSTVSTGTWYHIAIVRNNSVTTIYRDGTSVGSAADTSNYSYSSGSLIIGGGSGTGFNNYYLNGYLDDLRITKGYARYTSNFTAPTSAFPIF